MKVKLVNSTIMPMEGKYKLKRINKSNFCEVLLKAWNKGILESYIGYQDNIDLIAQWVDIVIPFSRANAYVEDGDVLLVMKLNKRMGDPKMKGKIKMKEEDFEFFFCEYHKLPSAEDF